MRYILPCICAFVAMGIVSLLCTSAGNLEPGRQVTGAAMGRYTRVFWGTMNLKEEKIGKTRIGETPMLTNCVSLVGQDQEAFRLPIIDIDTPSVVLLAPRYRPMKYIPGRRYLVLIGLSVNGSNIDENEEVLQVIDLDENMEEAKARACFTRAGHQAALAGPVNTERLDGWYADIAERARKRQVTVDEVVTALGEPDFVETEPRNGNLPVIRATYFLKIPPFRQEPSRGIVTYPALSFIAEGNIIIESSRHLWNEVFIGHPTDVIFGR